MTQDGKNGLTYAEAGVDIDAGNALVERIKPAAARTKRPGVASALGGFGGLFDLKAAGFTDPVLVAATDGVGTKLRIAIDTGHVDGVGIDLVAMCVNDLVCQGAEPLFFLDYFATGKLEVDQAARIVEGIAAGCEASGCALLGGETAEMPGMYPEGDFDLAGFAVGAMERGTALPASVTEGDVILGLASDGVHSTGYSLVRRVVEASGLNWDAACPWGAGTLGAALLSPTRLYVRAALAALAATLEPEALAISDRVLALMQPPFDSREPILGRERIESRRAPLFDPLAAAGAAARLTLGSVLDGTRMARVTLQHARDAEQLGPEEVFDALSQVVFAPGAAAPEVQYAVQWQYVTALVTLDGDADADAPVRAAARQALGNAQRQLEHRRLPQSAAERSWLARVIARYLSSGEWPAERLPAVAEIPPGSPIGSGSNCWHCDSATLLR